MVVIKSHKSNGDFKMLEKSKIALIVRRVRGASDGGTPKIDELDA